MDGSGRIGADPTGQDGDAPQTNGDVQTSASRPPRGPVTRVVLVTGAMALAAAALGFAAGDRHGPPDAGDAIRRIADRHAAETGGTAGTCLGVPGDGAVWIEVRCGGLTYRLDRRGRVMTTMPEERL